MLINKTLLSKYSILPKNFDYAEIMNYVPISEKVWIEPIIGHDFYEELCKQVEENNLTPENSTALAEAIYPYLGFAVVYEALPSLMYHISEVSITKGHSDNSEAISLKEIIYFQQHVRSQLEVQKDYCKKWLCEHYQSFPNLNVCGCNCDCCNDNAKLTPPNTYQQLYRPRRKNTDLK